MFPVDLRDSPLKLEVILNGRGLLGRIDTERI
jgi:hypothetical protein